jgi:hypothetical protein
MTVKFLHDDNIDNLIAAYTNHTLYKQKDVIYQIGNKGKSDGAHVHIAVLKGSSYPSYLGASWDGNGDVYAYKAFFVDESFTTSVIHDYGYPWIKITR